MNTKFDNFLMASLGIVQVLGQNVYLWGRGGRGGGLNQYTDTAEAEKGGGVSVKILT